MCINGDSHPPARLQPSSTSYLASDVASHPIDTLHSRKYHMKSYLFAGVNYEMAEDKVSGTSNTSQIISCNQGAGRIRQLFSSRRNLWFLPKM